MIAERLGNTPQMILDLYGHNFKALEEESVVAFEKALNFSKLGEVLGKVMKIPLLNPINTRGFCYR